MKAALVQKEIVEKNITPEELEDGMAATLQANAEREEVEY